MKFDDGMPEEKQKNEVVEMSMLCCRPISSGGCQRHSVAPLLAPRAVESRPSQGRTEYPRRSLKPFQEEKGEDGTERHQEGKGRKSADRTGNFGDIIREPIQLIVQPAR